MTRFLPQLSRIAASAEEMAATARLMFLDDAFVAWEEGAIDRDTREEIVRLVCSRKLLSKEPVTWRPLSPLRGDLPDSLDIVIACGSGPEDWNPKVARERGIGGSETAVLELAKRFALSHDVSVYGSCGSESVECDGNLRWRHSHRLLDLTACDVLIAWRSAEFLQLPIQARRKLLWVHDLDIASAERNPGWLLEADAILPVSQWHARQLAEKYPSIHEKQLVPTRNGIDPRRFETLPGAARNPRRAICSSSPDRYLPALLEIWPRVHAVVPNAEMHLFYGIDDRADAETQKAVERAMKTPGLVWRGRVPQAELASEMIASGVWAYPTWFEETACISAMEAQAAGLRCVTSPVGALRETLGNRAVWVNGVWKSDFYRDQFVEALALALVLPEGDRRMPDREKVRAYALEHFGWDAVVRQFEDVIRKPYPTVRPYKALR